jgi:hypothetical protein
MRWLVGFVRTCLGAFAIFVAWHFARFYIGLGWTIALTVCLVLLLLSARIVWIGVKVHRAHRDGAN